MENVRGLNKEKRKLNEEFYNMDIDILSIKKQTKEKKFLKQIVDIF